VRTECYHHHSTGLKCLLPVRAEIRVAEMASQPPKTAQTKTRKREDRAELNNSEAASNPNQKIEETSPSDRYYPTQAFRNESGSDPNRDHVKWS
jgi:hypothetical protein